MSRAGAVAVAVGLLAASCGGGGGGAGSSAGSWGSTAALKVIDTAADVRLHGQAAYAPGQSGHSLAVGDTVRTDLAGFAELDYPDGSLTRLAASTTFTLTKLVNSAGSRQVGVKLGAGKTWNRVQKVTFGELGVLARMARTGSAECLEDSRLWAIPAESFLSFVYGQPVVAKGLLEALARHVITDEALMEDLLFLDLRARVAKRLLALVSESWDEPPAQGTALPWDVNQTDLASLCGGSRERVSRILMEFQRGGMVERVGRRYILRDVKGLRRLAQV